MRVWTGYPTTLLARYTYELSVELIYIMLDCNSSADEYLKPIYMLFQTAFVYLILSRMNIYCMLVIFSLS
jgi:hypothetical protein